MLSASQAHRSDPVHRSCERRVSEVPTRISHAGCISPQGRGTHSEGFVGHCWISHPDVLMDSHPRSINTSRTFTVLTCQACVRGSVSAWGWRCSAPLLPCPSRECLQPGPPHKQQARGALPTKARGPGLALSAAPCPAGRSLTLRSFSSLPSQVPLVAATSLPCTLRALVHEAHTREQE